MTDAFSMDIRQIMGQLPHRYPFLMVDRVIECVPGEYIDAIKNVSINEPYFAGHFPGHPVMPGVMIVEALAQTAGLLAFATTGRSAGDGTIYYFVGIDKARFKKQVLPGDQLQMHAKLKRTLRGIWQFEASAKVDGKIVATADMMCAPGADET